MKYRPEIDGLRAVAILPVVLFHAGFGTFSGGFVGVDVFFVISGYLITTIILSEKEQGIFSLVNFYERRARRILPALFLVMFVSLPFAWMWLMPSDMRDYSQSLMAVSTFVSNILFWKETGYWGAGNEFKPLLHTWSLAVEEQYYVLFPLFLMLMWQFRKSWILSSFLLTAVLSLWAAQWGATHHPVANFFLLPTRGWELAIGASIAFYFLYRKHTMRTLLTHKYVDELLAMSGLFMIVYAVVAFDETVPFPGLYALIPTVGTGLIIVFSSPQNMVGRLLATRIMVGIGLISYSAYLWHQPLFAFARHRVPLEPSEQSFLLLSAFSFLLAYLSWRFVESPFRNKRVLGRKAVFAFAIIGSVAFIAIGLAGHVTDGFANRSTESGLTLRAIDEKLAGNYGLSRKCEDAFTLSSECRTSDHPEVLVWGDSYAMHLVQGILSSNPDAKIIQMTKSVCGPFFDVAPVLKKIYPTSWARDCLEFSGHVREWLQANDSVKYAVVSSPFSQYVMQGNGLLYRNGDYKDANMDAAVQAFLHTLGELEAMGIAPVVFSPLPQSGVNFGRCLARAGHFGLSFDECDFSKDELSKQSMAAYRFLDSVEERYPVIRLDDFVCDGASCRTHFGATFLYRDSEHLSAEGSARLGKMHDFYGKIVDADSRRLALQTAE